MRQVVLDPTTIIYSLESRVNFRYKVGVDRSRTAKPVRHQVHGHLIETLHHQKNLV